MVFFVSGSMTGKCWMWALGPALMVSCAAPRDTVGPELADAYVVTTQHGQQHGSGGDPGRGHHSAEHVSVFVGAVQKEHHGHDETTEAIGIDWEHHLTDEFGAGVIVDYSGGPFYAVIVAVGLFYHPTENVTLVLAPGVETEHDETKAMARIGASYGFDIGHSVTMSPGLYYDIVEHAHGSLVFGVSFGMGF